MSPDGVGMGIGGMRKRSRRFSFFPMALAPVMQMMVMIVPILASFDFIVFLLTSLFAHFMGEFDD
jgi:hypothetical protein